MNRAFEIVKTALVVVLIAGAVIVWPYLNARATANCQAINENRREGEVRAHVLRRFLTLAADARYKSAKLEIHTNPGQSVVDFAAAEEYRGLIAQVHNLPLRAC